MAAREIRGKGSFALAAPVPNVKQFLDLTGAANFARIRDTATEAVETFRISSTHPRRSAAAAAG